MNPISPKAKSLLLASASILSLMLGSHAYAGPLSEHVLPTGSAGSANPATPIPSVPGVSTDSQQLAAQQAQTTANLNLAAQRLQAALTAQANARAAAQAAGASVANGLTPGGLVPDSGLAANGAANPVLTWVGANTPTQTTSGSQTTVNITQTQAQALLNWKTFNVGQNTTVNFAQPSASSVALNKVNDPSAQPSQILGQINAPGSVYVINHNGVIFGGTSQINVNSLVASSADLSPTQFFNNGIYSTQTGSTYNPSFTDAGGAITVQPGASITTNTPTSATQSGGFVLLMGTQVTNQGSITTPQGQTELAAGDNFILRPGYGTTTNPTSTTRGNEIAVSLNTPGSSTTGGSGLVSNSGLIQADTGDVTLAGETVSNDGTLLSTTSVNIRGTIHLLSSASDPFSSVILASGSLAAILPDTSGATALDSQRTALITDSATQNTNRASAATGQFDNLSDLADLEDESRIEIVTGGSVEFQNGSLTLANGGQVAVSALGRVQADAGAMIDVSGLANVSLRMSMNQVEVSIEGVQLADNPQNRDTKNLFNDNVYVNVNDLVLLPAGTGGYATDRYYTPGGLLEVSGYLGTTPHTIGEWMASGGTITLSTGSSGSVVAQPGATFNIAGGTVQYQAGYLQQSYVIASNGQVYNINNAPSDLTYTGLANSFQVNHDRWVVTQNYSSGLFNAEIYQPTYTVGRDAGNLILSTPTSLFEGSVDASVYAGANQTAARPTGVTDPYTLPQDVVPLAGSLTFATYTSQGQIDPFNSAVTFGADPAGVASGVSVTSSVPTSLADTAYFDAAQLSSFGLGGLTVTTSALIAIDAPLTLANGGQITLTAPDVDVAADITARGGSLSITNIFKGVTDSNAHALSDANGNAFVTLEPGVAVNTQGLWTNGVLDSNDLSGEGFVNGGAVSIDTTGNVTISAGSAIDTSSGAAITSSGAQVAGQGGNITLVAGDPNAGTPLSGATLNLAGSLSGYGVSQGGALTLEAASVLIGDNAQASAPGQLVLPTAFFAQGFSSYTITGEESVTVAPGAQIDVVEPVYAFNPESATVSTGADPFTALTIWTPPVYTPNPAKDTLTQRAGASLTLTAGIPALAAPGPMSIGSGSAITVDPGQAININSTSQITVDGTLTAPGGAISLVYSGQLATAATNFNPEGRSIWIGGDATLNVAGQAVTAVDALGRTYGIAPAGGSIFLGGAQTGLNGSGLTNSADAFIIIRPGAVLDASGSSAVVDGNTLLVPTAGALDASAGAPTTVAGNGGSITLSSYDGIYVDGTLRAAAGGPGAAGGTLSVILGTPVYGGLGASPDPLLLVPRIITLSQGPLAALLPADLQAGADDPSLLFGQAQFSADTLEAGGFDNLSFSARDAILFNGNVNLQAGQSIAFHQGVLADTSTSGVVNIAAPYVLLDGYVQPIVNEGYYPTIQSGAPSSQQSTGSFSVQANQIDIANAVQFGVDSPALAGSGAASVGTPSAYDYAGFGNVDLTSQGDVRFLGATLFTTDLNNGLASLTTSGDVAVTAAQVYPVAYSQATITSLAPDGVIAINAINGSDPQIPYSVGGTLTLKAATIDQGGVLRAPLGTIALDGTSQVNLLAGSLTSSSGNGLTIPYGGTTDGTTYSYDGQSYGPGDITPIFSNTVNLNSPSIAVAKGATTDVSGGGDLAGAGFVSGEGGSVNVITTPLVSANPSFSFSSAHDAVYAIVPSYRGGYAPVDPTNASNPAVGQQITISGIPGLAAGTYTLLPANYATLPGAFRVEIGGKITTSGANSLGNGSYVVAGYAGIAGTSIKSTVPEAVILTSGTALRDYSQYNETSFSDFLVQNASALSQYVPILPADAGELVFNFQGASTTNPPAFSFAGTGLFAPGSGGFGGTAAVIGGGLDFEITDGTPTAGFTGVSLNAADLDAIGAPRLSIGSTLNTGNYDGSGVIDFTTSANSVTLRSGTVLSAPEVLLSADGLNGITIEGGAEIDTIGTGAAPVATGAVIGYSSAGAMLLVSNSVTPLTASGTSPISIGADAELLSSGQIAFGSAGGVAIDNTAVLGTSVLGLTAPSINIGETAALANAVVPAGFDLSPETLQQLLSGNAALGVPAIQTLTLTASQSLNFYGTVDLAFLDPSTGKADGQLVLNTPAIYGYGDASDSASLTVGTLIWTGAAGAAPGGVIANGAGTGTGTLTINANQIVFGAPSNVAPISGTVSRAMFGFSTVNLTANEITSNGQNALTVYQAQAATYGAPNTGGALNLNTPLLDGAAGSVMNYTAGGAITVAPAAGAVAPQTPNTGLGGEIDLNGASIAINAAAIDLPSGKLSISAQNDISLGAGADLNLAGLPVQLNDQTEYAWGGTVSLLSAAGNITLAPGSIIDVSAIDNNAGSLTVQAVGSGAGQVALNGTLNGASTLSAGASGSYSNGSITVDAQTLASGQASNLSSDFAALETTLTTGGFTQSQTLDLKQGDLTIGDGVKAHAVNISVDGGALTINGTIDASGAAPGSITLASTGDLTLAASGVLDAHGSVLQVDSYGNPIDTENQATINLSTVNGTLTLAPGSTLDVSSPESPAQGQVNLNAPRLGSGPASATGADAPANATGNDIAISAGGPINIKGAASIAINGFATYANAPADPNASPSQPDQFITQAYLDQINTDSQAFINTAWANTDLQSRLAGLETYGSAFHLRPGVELVSATSNGSLTVLGDLDFSGYRYGPKATGNGTGEPGVIVVRSGDNLNIYGSVNDGFSPPPATPDDNGWTIVSGTTVTADTTTAVAISLSAGTTISTAGDATLGYAIPITSSFVAANAVIPIALTTSSSITLVTPWTTTAQITLPGGQVIAKGVILPTGTVIPSGAVLAAGSVLPVTYSIPAMTIPAGTPIGFLRGNDASAARFVTLSGSITVNPGQVIPAGSVPQLPQPPLPDTSNSLTNPYTVTVPLNVTFNTPFNEHLNFAFTPTGSYQINLGAAVPGEFTTTSNVTTTQSFVATASISYRVGTTVPQVFAVRYAAGDIVPAGTNLRLARFGIDGNATVIPAGALGASTSLAISYIGGEIPAGADLSAIFVNTGILLQGSATVAAGAILPAGLRVGAVSIVGNSGPVSAGSRPLLPNGNEGQIWAVAPMLPQGDLSWSMQFVSGADLSAASTQVLTPQSVLNGGGNLVLNDPHYGGGSSFNQIDPSVLRTGAGSLSLLAGGDFDVNSQYGIYTAGTQSASTSAYQLPRGLNSDGSGTVLGAGNSGYEAAIQDYQAYYPTDGGDLLVSVQGDLSGANGSSGNAIGNWLWRQGGSADQPAAWWINFGTFAAPQNGGLQFSGFTGFGALGGGNVTINVGGDAGTTLSNASSAISAAVGATGRVLADGSLLETGGGDLTVNIGGALNSSNSLAHNNGQDGVFADLRGDIAISAGQIGSVNPVYGRNTADDLRASDALTSGTSLPTGGIVLAPGDGSATIETRGDLVLGGVSNPGLVTQSNLTPFTATVDGVSTAFGGGENSWFSLWTDATAVNLFSAGGNLTPSTQAYLATNFQGYSGANDSATGTAGNFMVPANLSVVAASGSVYLPNGQFNVTQPISFPIELAPSPTGQLTVLAADSIYNLAVDMSGADPSTVPTPFNPAFSSSQRINGTFTTITNTSPNSQSAFFAFGPDTATGALHADDPNPILIEAVTGDIVQLEFGEVLTFNPPATQSQILPSTWYIGAKSAIVEAGQDIIDAGTPSPVTISSQDGIDATQGFILNLNPTDVSVLQAGRDISYSSMQIAGPGTLVVDAGRNFYAPTFSTTLPIVGTTDFSGVLNSLGPIFNIDPNNPDGGAGISLIVGAGPSGPDYARFASLYLNPVNQADPAFPLDFPENQGKVVQAYQDQLYSWLLQTFGYTGSEANELAFFDALGPQQQSVFLLTAFYNELDQADTEYNDPTSPLFKSYVRGRTAIATLFPTASASGQPINYNGAITMSGGSGVHTEFGGDIDILTPGGASTIGVEGPIPPSTAGVVTQGAGDVNIYSLGSVELGQSRVFTTFGGNITIWSATGNIDAGKGAKTTVVYSPPRQLYDDYGNRTLSPTVPSQGAGIATLAPIPQVPPGNVYLVAPEGVIDAGEAGIRVSGNVYLAAIQVLNATNIQVKGQSFGLPPAPVTNLAFTSASVAATEAANIVRSLATAQPTQISVEVTGFGGEFGQPEVCVPSATNPCN